MPMRYLFIWVAQALTAADFRWAQLNDEERRCANYCNNWYIQAGYNVECAGLPPAGNEIAAIMSNA